MRPGQPPNRPGPWPGRRSLSEPESESLAGLDDASSVTLNTVSVSGSELEVSPADAERIQDFKFGVYSGSEGQ